MIPAEELLKLGFTEKQPRFFEDEFSYDLHHIKKNDCELEVMTEFDLNNKAKLQYVEFNGAALQGPATTVFALEFLIKMM